MTATAPFVLSPDVAITPVRDLSPRVRRAMDAGLDDYAVTRRYSRSVARVVDKSAADLLRLFTRPVTIAEAVIVFSRERGTDPREQLRAVFPFLQDCVDADFLVPADSEEARPIIPVLAVGAKLDAFTVMRCVQMATDADVYEVRDRRGNRGCAKVARMADSPVVVEGIANEVRVLRRLDGAVSPDLIGHGVTDNRPYVVASWHEGATLEVLGNEIRNSSDGRAKLLDIARRVVDAYAGLHERRVLHADVHPKNILVSRARKGRGRGEGRVVLIDFGLARVRDRRGGTMPRAGVSFLFEPEYARAALAGEPLPAATALGEQYAVAAVLYRLFTGLHYLEFSWKNDALLSQIAHDPPLSFSARGEAAWPELEDCLGRALSKRPRDRFRSMSDFAARIRAVRVPRKTTVHRQRVDEFTKTVLQRLAIRGTSRIPEFIRAPTASVNFGAAGVAYALYRIACARDEPELLALADVWNARALESIGGRDALFNDSEGITESLVGRGSLYHSLAGIYYVDATLAHASGDLAGCARAIDGFLGVGRLRARKLDVTLGLAGTLLACTDLHSIADTERRGRLASLGESACSEMCGRLASMPSMGRSSRLNLGAAHGWAGVLYAVMRSCGATGFAPPPWLHDRLDELANLAISSRVGTVWPWISSEKTAARTHPVMSGWCNGGAGLVYLWTLAHSRFSEQRFLDLAEGAAVNVAGDENPSWDLCCGAAGRAYALLHLWRYTRDSRWLRGAERLTARATHAASVRMPPISEPSYANGLMRGVAGVALLAAELARPDDARMPLFEPDPWPARTAAVGTST